MVTYPSSLTGMVIIGPNEIEFHLYLFVLILGYSKPFICIEIVTV